MLLAYMKDFYYNFYNQICEILIDNSIIMTYISFLKTKAMQQNFFWYSYENLNH